MKEGPRIDGMNVLEVYEQISEAVEYARKNGPILVESLTYRLQGHSMGDRSGTARRKRSSSSSPPARSVASATT